MRQAADVSTCSVSQMSIGAVTATSNSIVTTSVEPSQDAHSKKTTCSRHCTESTVRKSKVNSTEICQADRSSRPGYTKPSQTSESHGPDKLDIDKNKSSQPAASSSCLSLTTDTSPQISVKLAKGKRGQKIRQPQEIVSSTQQSSVQKSSRQTVAVTSCSSSTSTDGTVVGCHKSSTKSGTSTMSNITHVPNGLVAHAGKTCAKTDHHSQTHSTAPNGNLAKPTMQLLAGLPHHQADKHPAKMNHLVQNDSNPPQHRTGLANGPSSSCSTDKTSKKVDSVAGAQVEQNGHVKTSKSSDAYGTQASCLPDISEGPRVNGHVEPNAAVTATKGKKARRKSRGKEALTSVG